MIVEIAELRIRPNEHAAFQEAIESALRTVHAKAEGRHGWQLFKCIETPERYFLHIFWDSVEAHQAYRKTPLSPQFRALVGERFYAQPASMEHFELVARDD